MLISELIQKLQEIKNTSGDLEVLVSDGYVNTLYRGEYDVMLYIGEDGTKYADIGVGGCMEE